MPIQLLDLPHELLSHIALYLYDPQHLDDLKHLRLVSRACQDVGIEHLFAYKRLAFGDAYHLQDYCRTAALPASNIRGACRELHLLWCGGDVPPEIENQAWLEGLQHIRRMFPAVVHLHLQVVGTGSTEVMYAVRHFLARSPSQRSLSLSLARHRHTPASTIPAMSSGTSIRLPYLTYLKVEGRACQLLFGATASPERSPFPSLTSLSISDDPSAQIQQVAASVEACPTVTKLSIYGCPSLPLVPLLSTIEAHLGESLVSLRIVRWEAGELDPPAAGFTFAKLEALSVEDGSDNVHDDDDGLNLSEISSIVAATVKVIQVIVCPAMVHFNLQWRSVEANEATTLSLRDHLSCAKRFPALRLLYSRPSQHSQDDDGTSRVPEWLAAEAASQYTILWNQPLARIMDIFGAGRQPCV